MTIKEYAEARGVKPGKLVDEFRKNFPGETWTINSSLPEEFLKADPTNIHTGQQSPIADMGEAAITKADEAIQQASYKLTAADKETYAEAERLKATEGLERSRIEERVKTSNALYEAGVMPTTRKLRITNYFDSSKRNPRPDTTLYQDDEIIDVFDATGSCIGRIEEGIWKWRHKDKEICISVQNIKQSRRK